MAAYSSRYERARYGAFQIDVVCVGGVGNYGAYPRVETMAIEAVSSAIRSANTGVRHFEMWSYSDFIYFDSLPTTCVEVVTVYSLVWRDEHVLRGRLQAMLDRRTADGLCDKHLVFVRPLHIDAASFRRATTQAFVANLEAQHFWSPWIDVGDVVRHAWGWGLKLPIPPGY